MTLSMASPDELAVKIAGLDAYVVVDRLVQGLAGGGLRFHPSVDLHEMRRLARTMTQKWALLGLPFGGCKLGIRGRPDKADMSIVLEGFAREVKTFVRGRIFTGPDMGTSPSNLRIFFNAVGQDSYDIVAKRLRSLGYHSTPKGTYITILRALQVDITGLAAARAAAEAWRKMGGSLEDVTVSIQGFGSVGRAVAQEMNRLGATVVCIADELGCLWNPKGLDLSRLSGSTPGLMSRHDLPHGTEEQAGEQWLGVDAEVLVPAAVADAINWDNLQKVHAKMVVEAANIPVPEDVEEQLHKSGTLVLPDFLVNGGLAAAFGTLLTSVWERQEDVLEDVVGRIVSSTSQVIDRALTQGRLPREVAREVAMCKLQD